MHAWENIAVTSIAIAIYVPPDGGTAIHTDRPFHGLVLNDPESEKDYIFSDGTILHTNGNDLFYLPKGSTYRVKNLSAGGCYAINFDCLPFSCAPFSISFRNLTALRKHFQDAASAWKKQSTFSQLQIMQDLYNIILLTVKEKEKQYIPGTKEAQILPAIEKMRTEFTDSALSVSDLSAWCGISEAYFRRIFTEKFGISPKEYISVLRIEYAKKLLYSGQFPISDTAHMCGFSESCHFSREFKKRVGCTPSEYKTHYMVHP